MRPRRFWWQLWRPRGPWWLPVEDYDDGLPYGASSKPDPDLWEYGRKSGWW